MSNRTGKIFLLVVFGGLFWAICWGRKDTVSAAPKPAGNLPVIPRPVTAKPSKSVAGPASLDLMIIVIREAESGGDTSAIGDHHLKYRARGDLQIRYPCMADCNRWWGTHYQPADLIGDPELSERMCRAYLEHYGSAKRLGHRPTYQDWARIWNGGPWGCFDGGAINKDGRRLKPPGARRNLAAVQADAERYWQKRIKPLL